MQIPGNEQLIANTKKWIQEVVIGCNFCPFAAKEVKNGTVRYVLAEQNTTKTLLPFLSSECELLDNDSSIETTIVILPTGFEKFSGYLKLVERAENLLEENGHAGIYQVASFHPLYCFAGTAENDAANFTNRSPYPMLHLLREDSIEKAIARYPNAEGIPDRNIEFARKKGSTYMQMLRDSCF